MMKRGERRATDRGRDADLAGAEAAMHRAARRAQQRARDVANAAAQRQPNENSDDTSGFETTRDLHKLTFSQAQGYEEIPGPLKLEELPQEARTHIWNVFYRHLDQSSETWSFGEHWISGVWKEILRAKHISHDNLPIDDWSPEFSPICQKLRHDIETMPFNKVFDLLQFVFRQPQCPPSFLGTMMSVFTECRLAYKIDEGEPPTIIPAFTEEEGNAVIESLKTLREAGLGGSTEHLRNACECINKGDWAGSIRESIHTVESVARKLAPKAMNLKPALASIKDREGLHPALGAAFIKLYGYTSEEPGVRHPLLDSQKAKVGMDEAVFMLGACASFASYLWRKHTAGEVP